MSGVWVAESINGFLNLMTVLFIILSQKAVEAWDCGEVVEADVRCHHNHTTS